MAGEVTSNTMRVVIQSVQQTSGPQFGLLLRAAGLERFVATLPAADMQFCATGEELVRLFHTVYEMLGEDCTRLFHRNCGVLFAEGTLAGRWGQDMLQRAPQIPAGARLAWFARELAEMAGRAYSPQILTEDATAWYLASEVCYTCLGIHNVSAPLCAAATMMYKGLADKLVGRRVRVAEVTCAAMGAPHCKFALYK